MQKWTLIKRYLLYYKLGMSGVLIGCHPSLYTCEEIQDDFFISELET